MPQGIYQRIEEHNKHISEALTGRKLSKEHRKKAIENLGRYAKKGNILSKEIRRKVSLSLKGHGVTKETREKISKANRGEKNAMWKGDKAKYRALHIWVKRRKPKPKFCKICKKREPHDLANISGEYKREINDFEWLCKKCHIEKDGIMKNLLKGLSKNVIRDSKTGRFGAVLVIENEKNKI